MAVLVRVWEEYSGGPEGIFLKRGKKIRLHRSDRFPYIRWDKLEDPVRTRLYYSKSFIYPLAAAPFVVDQLTYDGRILSTLQALDFSHPLAYLYFNLKGDFWTVLGH